MKLLDYKSVLLSPRQQAETRNRWLRERLDTLLYPLMQRADLNMWLVVCREYNEDPVVMSLLPEPAMSARRRTILAFVRDDGEETVHRYSVDRYGHGDFYENVWKPEEGTQWEALLAVVKNHDPERIGLNFSKTFAFGDGLSYTEAEQVYEALGDFAGRCVSAEAMVIGWLETRTQSEIYAYPLLVEMGHALIQEAFSTRVIHPGVTTTDDVIWWMRQTMQDMGLRPWFQPSCEIQAPGQSFEFLQEPKRKLIQPGDLLWCDVGFHYLGLATDQQQHAYVLKPGESDAPKGLNAALKDGKHVQDIHLRQMRLGRTGNEVLEMVRKEAEIFGLKSQIYSHPLGYHGHAAGPTIGLWDQQDGVPGRGDYKVYDRTAYSIELNIRKEIPEWDGQEVRIALEEDAIMQGGTLRWLHGRQESFHLIG